jgi:hypothetical protein
MRRSGNRVLWDAQLKLELLIEAWYTPSIHDSPHVGAPQASIGLIAKVVVKVGDHAPEAAAMCAHKHAAIIVGFSDGTDGAN